MDSLLVIICTRNPRREFLTEAVAALRAQTLAVAKWNLLIVDNSSTDPLSSWVDLSWHPSARIVCEANIGIGHARHRALEEAQAARADVVLFVDDDNILNPDYLARGLELGAEWPQLGCWGGQLLPRYATTPPDWIKNYLNCLAITPLLNDRWANCVGSYDVVPPTAGCFIRAAVQRRYLEMVEKDPRRLTLGAFIEMQIRGEDTDMVLTAIDLELGVGRFRDLKLTHIVPASRLTPAYVTSVMEGTLAGIGLMEYLRYGRIPREPARGLVGKAILEWKTARLPEPLRSIHRAELRGKALARRIIIKWQEETVPRRPQNPRSSLLPA